MAAFEVLSLDPATPQIRAPGAGDTYTFPRAVEMPLGTANGVLYLNASNVVTSGSALQFNGSQLLVGGSTTVGAGAFPRFTAQVSNGDFLIGAQGGVNGAIRAGIIHNITANLGALVFATGGDNNNDATEKMRLDSSGNLGLGVTPSAWGGVINSAIEMQRGVAFSSQNNAPVGHLTANAFYNGTNWIYKQNGTATLYTLNTNAAAGVAWFTAASGTAGNAISFTQAMTLDASGNLALGTTTPFTRFDSASARTTALTSIASFNTMPVSVTDTTAFAQGVGGGINFRAQLSVSNYITYAAIWSFRESATTVDYRGSLLFGTAENGLGYPLERLRITSTGNQIAYQPAESAQNTSVTLTVANLQARIITSNAAVTLTLPTGTAIDGYVGGMAVDSAFECTFIATTANDITIAANGNTTVGSLTVAGNTSGTFRFRKTATNTFTVYRVA